MHRYLRDSPSNGFGDKSCKSSEDGGEFAGGQLHLLSHEVPDQKHRPQPCFHVKALSRHTVRFLSHKLMFIKSCYSAAACSVGVKILSKKLERLSLRFSRAIQMDLYSSKSYTLFHMAQHSLFLLIKCICPDPFMLGAAVSTFYINDAATILPRTIVAKTSAYIAGAAADVLEVKF